MSSSLNLDIHQLNFDEEGVAELVWPVPRAESGFVGDKTMAIVLEESRRFRNEIAGQAIALATPYFANVVMAGFEATALLRRSRALGREPRYPDRWAVVAAVDHGAPLPADRHIEILRSGPPRSAAWKAPFRWVRAAAVDHPLTFRPRLMARPRRDVFATTTGPVLFAHAALMNQPIMFGRYEWWFSTINGPVKSVPHDLLDQIMDGVHDVFTECDEHVTTTLHDSYRGWLESAGALMATHLQSLWDHHRGRLPADLWTGTGGNIWGRMLRHVCRRQRGAVTGHDHGTGAGLRPRPVDTVTELEGVETFITFTRAQADTLLRASRPDLIQTGRVPRVTSIDELGGLPDSHIHPIASSPGPRTDEGGLQRVMVVTTIYRGDRYHQANVLPEPVAVDFQARLFARLKSWDLEVLHKPHPESRTEPPAAFEQRLGIRTLRGRFEQFVQEADVVVIVDEASSTVLRSAMLTDRPVVIIDIFRRPWPLEARRLLERRCVLVGTDMDDSGRVRIDWEEMRSALEFSRSLDDPSFVDQWLGRLE